MTECDTTTEEPEVVRLGDAERRAAECEVTRLVRDHGTRLAGLHADVRKRLAAVLGSVFEGTNPVLMWPASEAHEWGRPAPDILDEAITAAYVEVWVQAENATRQSVRTPRTYTCLGAHVPPGHVVVREETSRDETASELLERARKLLHAELGPGTTVTIGVTTSTVRSGEHGV